MEVDTELMNEIVKLLKQMYDLSQKEDWDEPIAQFLVLEGGDLYADYFRNNN